jgi:type VI secretion system protein ImpH
MASRKRQPDITVAERLITEPKTFSFFKAVRLLEELAADIDALGIALAPKREPVRFSVKPGFAFPAAEIVSLEKPDENPPQMSVAFMGLIGPSGALPYWYNELAVNRNREKDFSLTAFLDIFHHRLISMFYLAWKKGRFAENYRENHNDMLSGMLLSIGGMGTKWLKEMAGLDPGRFMFFTGQLSRPYPNVSSLQSSVADLTGSKVEIEQFMPRSIRLGAEDTTALGMLNCALGVDTVIGNEIMDMQTGFRVDIGPVGYDEYLRYLPDGDMAEPAKAMVRFAAGIEYEYDLKVILKKEEVPALGLGLGYRMGQTAWLVSEKAGAQENKCMIIREKV